MHQYEHRHKYFWKGEKTQLRPLTLGDLDYMYARSFDSVSRQKILLSIEMPPTLEGIRESVENHANCKAVNGLILFVVGNHSEDRVGMLSLHSSSEKNGTFSFGISIDSEWQRHGFAFDAVITLLRYAFWEKRYNKCFTFCLANNVGTIALNRKVGLREEGVRKQQWFINGSYVDDIMWGMTRQEFDLLMHKFAT